MSTNVTQAKVETPRTDAAQYGGEWETVVPASLAAQLETELAQAKRELAECRNDRERLDWFEANAGIIGMKVISMNGVKEWWFSCSKDGWRKHGPFTTWRATIDAAMKGADK